MCLKVFDKSKEKVFKTERITSWFSLALTHFSVQLEYLLGFMKQKECIFKKEKRKKVMLGQVVEMKMSICSIRSGSRHEACRRYGGQTTPHVGVKMRKMGEEGWGGALSVAMVNH